MADLEKLVAEIEGLSILEVSELVKALEEKFGVSAVQTVTSGPSQGAGADASAVEVKDSFTVELTTTGENKIGVIKAIREINGELGLKEAKDLADKAPSVVAENVPTEKANEMKAKLEGAGAGVTLK